MLRRALLLLALVAGARAWAQDDEPEDGLRRPQQLTVGVGDQFLGQVSPDGKTLFFATNRNTTSEIYAQDLRDAKAALLFDEGADVTWPRVSPDGKQLLYISFRDRAAGQLCVRELADIKQRRCLDSDASALQAEWMAVGRVALLSRGSIEGNLRVSAVDAHGRLSARTLLERNLTGPALSPDGRWLVYLPVERYVERVGPGFAARASARLEAVRLDHLDLPPMPLPIDLPGMTGQPAFSRDGKSLYVAQFFDDSNQDGVIDASDHGVLFRVPFPQERDDAPQVAAAAAPLQLSDASWNCQYPAPSASELYATCSRKKNLAVYSLPLDGMVPGEWNAERLRGEIELSARSGEQLLLLRHLLGRETEVTARRMVMMRLIRLHLQADEIDPAEFYSRHVAALKDPATAGMASGLRTLIEQRRALHERERGRLALDFADSSRKRMESLAPNPKRTPVAQAFDHIVRSEIADTLGDLGAARAELEAVRLDDVSLPSVLQAFYDRAEALYRQLDDREALASACRALAQHPALSPDERLPYARATLRALTRGLSHDEVEAVLMRQNDAPDSELGFARDLERALGGIRDDHPPREVAEGLLALYHAQTRPVRRRQVMLDAVKRASDAGAERVVEKLAEAYVDDVKPGTEERRRAERLYQRVLLGRAYRRLAKQKLDEARADFEAVARKTRSLEAYIGAIDTEARLGAKPEALDAKWAHVEPPEPPEIVRFVKAYLIVRKLPHLDGEAHRQAVAAGIALLRGGWNELKAKREAQALFGALLHERYLIEDDREAAQRANVHYLIALDLARGNPREKAMVLGQLALLHSRVGNHRIALGYLDDREQLPYADNGAGLAVKLAKARTLLHVGREADAAKVADEAIVMIDRKPRLADYRVMAADRAALYHLAAGEFERALALYDVELPLIDKDKSERNKVVARLARAAAALGAKQPARALDDLAVVDQHLSAKLLPHGMRWSHATDEEILRSYRIIAAGLRANAHRALGQLDQAARALETRRALFSERLALNPDVHENLRAMTLVETRLADNAGDRGDAAQAASFIGKALGHADDTLKESGTAIDDEELDVLWFAAELRAAKHAPLPFNLSERLERAYRKLLEERDPEKRSYLRWFEIYLAGGD